MREYLIIMESIRDSQIQDSFICKANNFDNAVEVAFFTRNIANSWDIIVIESDDDENIPKFNRITFAEYEKWYQTPKKNRVNWVEFYNKERNGD